ncbi:MAG: hypothetical protein V8Q40_08225 [Anaerosacchariphilus sp.]
MVYGKIRHFYTITGFWKSQDSGGQNRLSMLDKTINLRTVEEYGKEKFVYSEKRDRGRGVSGWEIWGSGGSKGEEKEGNPGAGGKGESV